MKNFIKKNYNKLFVFLKGKQKKASILNKVIRENEPKKSEDYFKKIDLELLESEVKYNFQKLGEVFFNEYHKDINKFSFVKKNPKINRKITTINRLIKKIKNKK